MRILSFHRRNGRCTPFGRATGVLCASLVGLLIYLSADPEAHEQFHRDADQGDHACVVTAFAAGEAYYVAPVIEVRPQAVPVVHVAAAARSRPLESPRFLLPPACGPPARA
jgi:hypothetical protein